MSTYCDLSTSPGRVEQIAAMPKGTEDLDRGGGGDSSATVASAAVAPGLGSWRRVVGLLALLSVVFLWTASNFLASDILADRSYNKPFMVTYINTAAFVVPLIPILISKAFRHPEELRKFRKHWRARLLERQRQRRRRLRADTPPLSEPFHGTTPSTTANTNSTRRNYCTVEPATLILATSSANAETTTPTHLKQRRLRQHNAHLDLLSTARVSLEFSLLWFLSNYFVTACLEFTTVASSTILTSTSSIFTLFVGWQQGVETFTVRKASGVLASFLGVALIASLDASGSSNGMSPDQRGNLPEESHGEALLGDALALASAGFYGIYSVLMKKRLGDEGRVSMPVFFGFVGLFNVLLAWPGFIVLHFSGVEPFVLPPTGHVTAVLLLNSLASLLSDMSWAFAVLLTSPIVVSVGLSLTIPLSLVGQVLVNRQTTTVLYWLGAAAVVVSFVFVNLEDEKEEAGGKFVGGLETPEWRSSSIDEDDDVESRFDDDDDDVDEGDVEAMATSVDRLLR